MRECEKRKTTLTRRAVEVGGFYVKSAMLYLILYLILSSCPGLLVAPPLRRWRATRAPLLAFSCWRSPLPSDPGSAPLPSPLIAGPPQPHHPSWPFQVPFPPGRGSPYSLGSICPILPCLPLLSALWALGIPAHRWRSSFWSLLLRLSLIL